MQIGLALERTRLAEAAGAAILAAERESLRNTLLASISHDLRTPIAVVAGATSTLAAHGAALDETTRFSLARSIEVKGEKYQISCPTSSTSRVSSPETWYYDVIGNPLKISWTLPCRALILLLVQVCGCYVFLLGVEPLPNIGNGILTLQRVIPNRSAFAQVVVGRCYLVDSSSSIPPSMPTICSKNIISSKPA